jgi:hypothetical protein
VTVDQRGPYVKVLATLRECKLREHYTDEQRELQPDLAKVLKQALGNGFHIRTAVGGLSAPRPINLYGTSFWPDLDVSHGDVPVLAIEVKYIRMREPRSKGVPSSTLIAETIGQALIYRLHYPRTIAFILQEGPVGTETRGPEADLRGLLARCGVDLVRRHA